MFSRICTAGAVLFALATPTLAGSQSYEVGARDDTEVIIGLCSPRVDVRVRGNGSSNLDYRLKGPNGRRLFNEDGPTDRMQVSIKHGSNNCGEYLLKVENHGRKKSRFTVNLTDHSR